MRKTLLSLFCVSCFIPLYSQTTPSPLPSAPAADDSDTSSVKHVEEAFSWGDFTWLNGNDRRHFNALASKYFTGSVMLDVNYTNSFSHPIDHTVVGSSTLARDNEMEVNFAGFGGDFNYKNARGRLMLQFGTRSTVVPRNDFSTTRGQFDLANAYRYFSEAYCGHHWDKWNGINLDAGIFMSYIGLFSYYGAENWAYQPSFTSDNTPWFFNGARLQMFPTTKLKVEVWFINGWQSYGKFNEMPGIGASVMWRPKEYFSLVSNNYYGADTQDKPGRIRVHTDNSIQLRYFNQPGRKGINRLSFCLTADAGFEDGGGVTAYGGGGFNGSGGPPQNFVSAMAYNRAMIGKHFGWTVGGGIMHNPGRYLVLLPTGDAGPSGTHPFSAAPGDQFDGWDLSTTFDWMPSQSETFRIELVHRECSVPYFAGPGGVTSPDGYSTTPIPVGWTPDLQKTETRLIFAFLVRF